MSLSPLSGLRGRSSRLGVAWSRAWRRLSGRIRPKVAAVVVLALAAGGAAYVFDLPQLLRSGSAAPKLKWGDPATGREGTVEPREEPPSGAGEQVSVLWPAADRVEVPIGGPAATVGGVAVSAAAVGRALSGSVVVETYDRDTSTSSGVDGLLVKVSGDDSTVRLSVDYGKFAAGYGGDYGDRLRFYRAEDCDPGRPARGCADDMTPVPTTNDGEQDTVSATVDSPEEGATFAIAATGDSSQGTYQATALSPSSSWSVGGSSGGFSWSYPIRTPRTAGSLAPSVALSYSSQSTDGRTSATNNQGSWIGEGFTYEPGYIERRYKPCSDDGHDTSGDLCWAWDNATIMLQGRSGELVKDGTTWRLSSDDGSVVERLTGASNGDDNGEYWKLTTTDGTRYYFGRHRLPGWASGDEATNSVWTTPVFGDDSGEPCHGASFAGSHCTQAWRWNLDYVVDTHDNVISYFYGKETNHYALNGRTDVNGVAYTRGGYLKRVDYGQRDGSVYSTPAGARVRFTTFERCIPSAETTCDPDSLNDSTAQYWPDVPWDRNCEANTPCDTSQLSPSFWTRKRLTGITTEVRSGTGWAPVNSWKLEHAFITNGDATKTLWLSRITRAGHYGGTVTMPSTDLLAVQKPNRIDVTGDSISALIRPRLATIYTDTGGQIDVTYAAQDCAPGDTPAPATNTRRCYPVKWEPPSHADTFTDWFHKYVVAEVVASDRTGGSPDQVTRYEYLGGAAWRHTKPDGIAKAEHLTWADWRGYESVRVIGAPGTTLQTRTDTTYFRGMHGDKDGAGGTRSVSVTDSTGGSHTDYDELSGRVLESAVYNGTEVVSKSITSLWRHVTATVSHSWGDQTSTFVQPATSRVLTALEAGGWRETRTTNRYDTTYGRVVEVDDFGDTATVDDDRCTRTWYADNPDKNMVAFPSRSQTVAVPCAGTPDLATEVIADDRMYYDGLAFDAAPVTGDLTKADELTSHDGITAGYVTIATTGYDAYGRVTTVSNVNGAGTTAAYTDADGLTTKVVVTNALGHTSTTNYDPLVGEPSSMVDPNGKVTSLTYDPMGRLSAVWLPNQSKARGEKPNTKFSYQVGVNTPTVVKTETIKNDAVNYRASYELFDGWLRSRQVQSEGPGDGSGGPGRLVADTFYDALGRVGATNDVYHAAGAPGGTLLLVADGEVNGQTRTVYDNAGRPVTRIFAVAGQEKWRTTTAYGGDRIHVTPPSGGTATTTISDARGNITELRQYHAGAPTGSYDATSYTHTPRGQLATVVNSSGETWSYTYDQRGNKVATVDPDAGRSTTTYDNLGRTVKTTDPRGVTLTYDYDVLDRKRAVYQGEDPATRTKLAEWFWDNFEAGQLAGSRSYDGDLTFTHTIPSRDELYRPLRDNYRLAGVSAGALEGSYQFNRSFNLDGTLKADGFPTAGGLSGEAVVRTYDALGRLRSAYGEKTYAGNVEYYPTGMLAQVGLFAGAKDAWQTFQYEKGTNRLTSSYLMADGITGRLTNTGYSYDPAGNVTSIVDAPTVSGGQRDAQCFRYDHLRRLTQAWTTGNAGDGATACAADPTALTVAGPAAYWHDYEFAPNGNRTSLTVHATGAVGSPDQDTTSTYVYPDAAGAGGPHLVTDVIDSVSGVETGRRSYTYDEAGNTLTRPGPAGVTQTLTWDPQGHVATVTEGESTTSFEYDAGGNRYLRRDAGGTTLYLPGMELRQPAGSTTVEATRYYALPGGVTYVRTPAGGQYQTSDHHGTATVALDPGTGAVTHRRFDPYGNPRGPQPLEEQWAGERGFVNGTQDPTGLTHLGAREYDPVIGRFVSADPIVDTSDPQQMQGYAYGVNNPVTFSDPDGLKPWGGTNPVTGREITATPDPDGTGWKVHGDDEPDPDEQVDDAEAELRAAKARQDALKRKLVKIGKLFLDIMLEVTGIQAGLDCFLKGDVGACVETAISVITGAVGGLLVKIGAKYAFKWKAAARLAGKVKTLVGDIIDVASSWGKVAEGVANAKRNLQRARAAKKAAKRSDAGDGPSCPLRNSFSGDTKVVMADGSTKPIAEIKPGDKVLATDPVTGVQAAKTVTAVWVHQDTLVDLEVDGEAVTTTEDHPFWNATDQTWQDTQDLDPGDQLLTTDGDLVPVGGIDWTTTHTGTAYNLTVNDIHTYHVYAGDEPVLVHNCGGGINEKGKPCKCKDGDPIKDLGTSPIDERNKRWSGAKDAGKIVDQGIQVARGVPGTSVAKAPGHISPAGMPGHGDPGATGVIALVVIVKRGWDVIRRRR